VSLATVCLWLLVAASAASGLLSLIAVGRLPRAAEAREPALPVGAEGFAQLFVATYLEAGEGKEEALRPFYSLPAGLTWKGSGPGSATLPAPPSSRRGPPGRTPGR
jgi:hypothetical protein